MKITVRNMIFSQSYQQAYELFESNNYEMMCELILNIAFETESIVVYTFILFLLLQKESAPLHSLAAQIITQPMSHVQGSYQAGLMHIRRALELDPNNFDYKEFLLFFYDLQEPLVNSLDAEQIAQELLQHDPNHVRVRETLKLGQQQ